MSDPPAKAPKAPRKGRQGRKKDLEKMVEKRLRALFDSDTPPDQSDLDLVKVGIDWIKAQAKKKQETSYGTDFDGIDDA